MLGAPVGPKPGEPYEFGYYRIEATEAGKAVFPDELVVAQCHFHGFDLPRGAVHLAKSAGFEHQALRYGATTYALQFHAEVTRAGFCRWQDQPWAAFGKPGAQSRAEQDELGARHDAAQHEWFMGFLAAHFSKVLEQAVAVATAR